MGRTLLTRVFFFTGDANLKIDNVLNEEGKAVDIFSSSFFVIEILMSQESNGFIHRREKRQGHEREGEELGFPS